MLTVGFHHTILKIENLLLEAMEVQVEPMQEQMVGLMDLMEKDQLHRLLEELVKAQLQDTLEKVMVLSMQVEVQVVGIIYTVYKK